MLYTAIRPPLLHIGLSRYRCSIYERLWKISDLSAHKWPANLNGVVCRGGACLLRYGQRIRNWKGG